MPAEGPVLIRVLDWNEAIAWTADSAHTRGILVEMLRGSCAISNLDAKLTVKLILAKELHEVLLENGARHSSFTHALRSIGAIVEAIPVQQTKG